MTDLTRRSILNGGGALAALAIAGCPGDFPKHRELMFEGLEQLNDTGSLYRFRISPKWSSSGESDEWQSFHNVSVVGYSASGELVCEADIGDIKESESPWPDPVVLECDQYPVIFTYRADESPCDEDTIIRYAVYRTLPDGDSRWLLDEQRACGEGLPPNHEVIQN